MKYSSVEKVLIYDTKTDVWREGTNPPAKRIFGVVGVTSGVYAPQRVYVLGTETNYNYVYDPVTDVWSTATAMPTARFSFGVAVVDDILYAIGGGASNTWVTFLAVNQQYIPQEYKDAATVPESSKSLPIYLIVATAVLIVGIIAIISGFYFQKRKKETQKNFRFSLMLDLFIFSRK